MGAAMTDNDNFLDRLRTDARQLRFEPDEMMSTRIAARVRERIAAESDTAIAQILARLGRHFLAGDLRHRGGVREVRELR